MQTLVLAVILMALLGVVFVWQWINTRGAPNRLHAMLFEQTPRQRERAANEAAHPVRAFVMIALVYGGISWLFNSVDHSRTVVSIALSALLYGLTMVLVLRYKQHHDQRAPRSAQS